MFDFKEQLEIGRKGEVLIKSYYESQSEEGKGKYIVRDARKDEQLKGADFFIINNELGTRYIEVKTDTQSKETGNVALEIQIVQDDGTKSIGCQFKTFSDFMFYWIYPTNQVLYWNPVHLIPYIVDWIINDTYRIVEAQNKNFFSRSLIVPIEDLIATGVVQKINLSYHLLDKVKVA
tara:strand:- start:1297 stop:1827 length:531 start_codon:yes stop_codon:yes gene_type:complete